MAVSVSPSDPSWLLVLAAILEAITRAQQAFVILAVPLILYKVTSQRSATEDFCGRQLGRFKGLTLIRLSPVCCISDIVLDFASMIKVEVSAEAAKPSAAPFFRDLNTLLQNLDEGYDMPTDPPQMTTESRRNIWLVMAACVLGPHFGGIVGTFFSIYIIAIITHTGHMPRIYRGNSQRPTAELVGRLLVLVQFVGYGALWMTAQRRWACLVPGYESHFARAGTAVIILYLLFLLVILVAGYTLPWRVSSTILMTMQPILGTVMFLAVDKSQESKIATVLPLSVEFFLGDNLFSSTAAMLLPLLMSVGGATAIVRFWQGPGSMFKDHQERRTEQSPLPQTLEMNEFLRVFFQGITAFPAAIAVCEWLSDLQPEIQQLSFIIFNLLTVVVCLDKAV